MSLAPAPRAESVPLIGFGQVRHARLKPVRNAFSYATYFLMLPMRSLQRNGSGPLARNRWAPLSFFDADHGDGRGPAQGGALAWLDELLLAQGIEGADGEVWLHCYPRVLGHTFKPVSFWYCHLLDAPRFGVEQRAAKVFHVSPFCPVEGGYRFRFMVDPTRHRTVGRIDYDDASGPLLQTSVCGTLQALDARTTRQALWRYPAMTLGVVLRIHWQALKLFAKRVPFFNKPVPPTALTTR